MRLFLLYAILLVALPLSAQRRQLDSLARVLAAWPNHTIDTAYIDLLNEYGYAYRNSKPDSMRVLAQKADSLAKSIHYLPGRIESLLQLSMVANTQGQYQASLAFIEEAIPIAKSIGATEQEGRLYNTMANAYYDQGLLPEALDKYLASKQIMERLGNKAGIARSLGNIANIQDALGKYDEAINTYTLSMQMMREIGNKRGEAMCLNNIAVVYYNRKQYEEALARYTQSMHIREEIEDDYGIALGLANIGWVYVRQGKFRDALTQFERSRQVNKAVGDAETESWAMQGLAEAYLGLGQYGKSLQYGQQALKIVEEIGFLERIRDSHETLSKIYAAKGDGMLAYRSHLRFKQYADSINNSAVEKKTANLNAQYAYEKKELALKAEQHEQFLLHQQEIAQERLIRYGFAGAFLLMLLIVALVFKSMRRERETNIMLANQNKVIQQKNEEIQTQHEEIMQQNEEILAQKEYIEHSYQSLQLLSDIGKEVMHHIEAEAITNAVYAEVNRLMPAEGFGIGILNIKENRIEFPDFIEHGEKLPYHVEILSDTSLSSICIKERKEILINDMDAEIGQYLSDVRIIAGAKVESVIYMPLIINNEVVGNISVQSFKKNAYQNFHLDLLRNISIYVSIALDNAKLYERSETLLHNILPAETAKELKEKGYAEPRFYEQATVIFTDFKGFTESTATMSPGMLINDLDYCFRKFDKIVQRYGLEKIKTIGDAYMAVAGIYSGQETHASDTVAAALEMVTFMERWKQKQALRGLSAWDVRIGIHTGPVIAGVVGTHKFAYDIWGDTVNIAARMESLGEPGKVNISEATYQRVRHFFSCTHRGQLEVKGKGEMDMYFVNAMLLG